MDRIPNARYLFLASTLLLLGLANGALPYSPSLLVMYAASFVRFIIRLIRFISFFRGLASGSLDTGGNVLLLNIWEGRDSGPYMHALHFTFGIGAFLAPLISRPFLVNVEEAEHLNDSLVSTNLTEAEEKVGLEVEESLWTVKTLYPIVSAYPVLLSMVFIVFHVKDRKKVKQGAKKEEKEVENQLSKGFTIAIVAIVSLLFFLYVGMEV